MFQKSAHDLTFHQLLECDIIKVQEKMNKELGTHQMMKQRVKVRYSLLWHFNYFNSNEVMKKLYEHPMTFECRW